VAILGWGAGPPPTSFVPFKSSPISWRHELFYPELKLSHEEKCAMKNFTWKYVFKNACNFTTLAMNKPDTATLPSGRQRYLDDVRQHIYTAVAYLLLQILTRFLYHMRE